MHGAQLNGKGSLTHHYPAGMRPDHPLSRTYDDSYAALYQVNPLKVVWRRIRLIVLMAILVSTQAGAFSMLQAPSYEASIKVLIEQGQVGGNDGSQSNLDSEVAGLQALTTTMAEAIQTRPVAREVINRLGLTMTPESLQNNMTAEQIGETQLIEVSYRGSSPKETRLVAKTIGDVFSEQFSEMNPSNGAVAASVLEGAVPPDGPVSPDPIRNCLLGLAVGLMLGVGLAFLLDRLDDNWKSPEEVEQISGVPTFGVIPAFKVPKSIRKEA